MAKGVKKLNPTGRGKATRPIVRQKYNEQAIADQQLKIEEKRRLTTKGPHTGDNSSFK